MLATDDAIRRLIADPKLAQLVRDSYWTPSPELAAERFAESAEFEAVLRDVDPLDSKRVLDLGSGNGIASFAFASRGADVLSIEPNFDPDFGALAVRRACRGLPVSVVAAIGECLPAVPESFDIVYARQVLHHSSDLPALLREIARVLRPGGVFIATREHVVDSDAQLRKFLSRHPIHRLAGGEHAFSLERYTSAIREAGLTVDRVYGPWDTLINAFPVARTEAELKELPTTVLTFFLGSIGGVLARIPLVPSLITWLLQLRRPGALHSFVARKNGVASTSTSPGAVP